MKKHYLPKDEPGRVLWLKNFALKLPNYTGTLAAATAGACTSAADDALYYESVVQVSQNIEQFKQDVNKHKGKLTRAPQGTALPPFPAITITLATPVAAGIFTRIAMLVQALKADTNYDEAIGEDLGIVGDETSFDDGTAKPTLKLEFKAESVVVSFDKPREVDGIKLFCKRGTEADYTFLAVDTRSPYIDNRDNLVDNVPETRWYKAWYYVDDQIIGQVSDEVSIVVNIR